MRTGQIPAWPLGNERLYHVGGNFFPLLHNAQVADRQLSHLSPSRIVYMRCQDLDDLWLG